MSFPLFLFGATLNDLLTLVGGLFLVGASLEDWRTQSVNDILWIDVMLIGGVKLVLSLLSSGVSFMFNLAFSLPFSIALGCLFFYYGMGEADGLWLVSVAFLLSDYPLLPFISFFLGLVLAFGRELARTGSMKTILNDKDRRIALIPYLTLGFTIVYLTQRLLTP